ncbi:MAG: hypothetical protein WA061_02855 [Microgenomates group bacterium]
MSKFKQDFITNSSSSSFLVAFDKLPETVEEMKKLLFGERKEFPHPYNDDKYYQTEELAEIVFKETEVASDYAIFDFFPSDYDFDLMDKFRGTDGNYDWDSYNKAVAEIGQKEKEKFFSENPDKIVVVYNFSDNDPEPFPTLEHGNIFRNVVHIRKSEH